MGKATLVIMAAGMGSRFGGGIKQLEPVGPNGEIIMDYSIYDALEAGFDKVVFVIRRNLEKEFREVIGNRIEKKIDVNYAFQELDDIPLQYKNKFKGRTKPWGTGQAILCCKNLVHEPFLVINADDYYGKQAYKKAFGYLQQMPEQLQNNKLPMCMIGFMLKNTLSDNGGVTRGICKVGGDHMLMNIEEVHNIVKTTTGAVAVNDDGRKVIDMESEVSMNMWGLTPQFFDVLEIGFDSFLNKTLPEDLKAEYLLPTIIGKLLHENKAEVKVLQSKDKWFGVTYKADKETVVKSIKELIAQGKYKKENI